MSNLQQNHIINAPLPQVWNVIKDFGGVHKFHPKVESSPLLSDNNEGLGAARVCHFYDGTSVKEEVKAYRDGEMLRVELSEFSLPLNRAFAEISVRERGPNKTEVTFAMDYDVKFGPLGAVMNSMMLRPMMTKMFAQILEGLDHHVITGELVGRDGERIPVALAA